MEQMTNLRLVPVERNNRAGQASPWRSFGSVASVLMSRAEARQDEIALDRDLQFSPVAWAAE